MHQCLSVFLNEKHEEMIGLERTVSRLLSLILPPIIILALQLNWCLNMRVFCDYMVDWKPAIWGFWAASSVQVLKAMSILGGVWVWPPLMKWTKWGLTGDKVHAVLMKATELIHLFWYKFRDNEAFCLTLLWGHTSWHYGRLHLLSDARQAALPLNEAGCKVILPLAETRQFGSIDGSRNTRARCWVWGWGLSLAVFRHVSRYLKKGLKGCDSFIENTLPSLLLLFDHIMENT